MAKFFFRKAFFVPRQSLVVTYLPWFMLPLLALPLAVFFTFPEQELSVTTLTNERFWVACAWSYIPTILLIAYVQWINEHLDTRYCWQKQMRQRLIRQLLWALLLPALGLGIFYTVYFAAYGISIIERRYLQTEFPLAVFALGFYNALYAFRYVHVKHKQEQLKHTRQLQAEQAEKELLLIQNQSYAAKISDLKHPAAVVKKKKYAQKLVLTLDGVKTTVCMDLIICITHWEKFGLVFLSNAKCYGFDNTLEQLREQLDERIFSKCNRWCIVNLKQVSYMINDPEKEQAQSIIYKTETDNILKQLAKKEQCLLAERGVNGRPQDKYLLNRSFRKEVEERWRKLF